MIVGLLSFTQSKAQWKTLAFNSSTDSIITSSSLDTVTKIVPLTGNYATAVIKVEYTKNSGTVSLKAYLYDGDGTDYNTVTDSSAAFSNATGVVYFVKTSTPYSHYKVVVRPATGAATTQQVAIRVKYLPKGY